MHLWVVFFFFSSRRRHTRFDCDWSSDVCSSDLGAELTSYYSPPNLDHEFLIKIKRHAFLRGIDISGTAVGNTFTVPAGPKRDQEIANTKKWIDYASIMGAPHIRIFAGAAPSGMSLDEARQLCIPAIEECCDYAGGKGISLGLENHRAIPSVAEA